MRISYLLALLPVALAIFIDEAYKIDFHYALLGLPQSSTTFFHPPYPGSKASLIYTVSEKGVLGAVNPKDGSLVWRQLLEGGHSVLRFAEDQDTIVSAAGHDVNGWSASDGKFAWHHRVEEGLVVDMEVLDLASERDADSGKDVLILTWGANAVMKQLDTTTGAVKWTFTDSSDDIPYRIAASGFLVHLVSYQKTFTNGLKLKITSIDSGTGKKVKEYSLNADSEASSIADLIFVGSNSASNVLAWSNQARSVLKVNILGSSKISSFDIRGNGRDTKSIAIHAAKGNNALPHFLVHYQTAESHWAEIFHIDHASFSISKAYDLPNLAGHGVFSASTVESNVYFTRITEAEIILIASVSHGILERWSMDDLREPGVTERPFPVHATSEVAARTGSSFAIRSAVLLSNGDWILVRNGEKSWTRHEALAGVVKAAWVTATPQPDLIEALEAETHQGAFAAFAHRMQRHIHIFQNLPLFVQGFVSRTLTLTGEGDSQSDYFGFNKLVVVATENGRIIAIEAGKQGRIAWNIKGKNLRPGQKWDVSSASTVIAELLSNGGPLLDVGQWQSPDLLAWERKFSELSDVESDRKPTDAISYTIKDGSLSGYQHEKQIWQFKAKPGQAILSTTARDENELVASIGKVLGDRRVLYKYLNPNAVLVLAVNHARRQLSSYLVDSVSGTVLHTSIHANVDTSRPVASTISENWFTYSFTLDPASDSTSKGYQLVMSELLESDVPNDRGVLAASTNSSSINPVMLTSTPVVISQVYHIPEEISYMAVTQTTQGITSRELLVSLAGSNSIVAIPPYITDPRRIVGKEPTNSQREEGLTRYTPMIDFDPKWYLNHKEEVLGIRKIIATPAALESTSLIFAHGHDLFGTRVTPSFAFDVLGNSFNKVSMVLTVVALMVSVVFVAPLIERKQTNALWQSV